MKSLFVVLFTFLIFGVVRAQDKGIEAIAAYQLAEENFNAKKYSEAMEYITSAKDILGAVNSKILYLEIQIWEEITKEFPDYLGNQHEAIEAFEQAPDIDLFSQEKRLEVSKMKLGLDKRIKAYWEAQRKGEELSANQQQAMADFFDEYPQVDIPVAEFVKHPYAAKLPAGLKGHWLKALTKGAEYETYAPFTDNVENNRKGVLIETNKEGLVERYAIYIEVEHSDFKKAVEEVFGQSYDNLFGQQNQENGLNLIRDGKRIWVHNVVDKTRDKIKRNAKKDYLNYLTVYAEVYNEKM